MQTAAPWEMPSRIIGAAGAAVSATASRSWTQRSKERSPTLQSVIPQPRSSDRTKRKWSAKKRSQWRQTGLSQSYSRWVSQFEALTSSGPPPASAQAPSRRPGFAGSGCAGAGTLVLARSPDSSAIGTEFPWPAAAVRPILCREEGAHDQASPVLRLRRRELPDLLRHVPVCDRVHRRLRGAHATRRRAPRAIGRGAGRRHRAARAVRRAAQRDGAPLVQGGLDAPGAAAPRALHLRAALEP